jgi:hypothetical protein
MYAEIWPNQLVKGEHNADEQKVYILPEQLLPEQLLPEQLLPDMIGIYLCVINYIATIVNMIFIIIDSLYRPAKH